MFTGCLRFRTSFLISVLLPAIAVCAQQPDDFSHTVVPVLKQHCVPCHGGREAKGSFSMNTRELLVDSGHLVPGQPEESGILARIASQDPDEQMPPKDRPRLTEREQRILTQWIRDGAEWTEGFSFAAKAYEPPVRPRRVELPPAISGRTNPVDRILDAELAARNLPLPPRIPDGAFLRRVHLDLIGLLPEPALLAEFEADSSPDKRERMVRRLLDDRISWADHWLTFFNDLLRNDYSGTGFITGGRSQISTWLYDALLTGKPYDQMTRELIAPPTSASQGFIDGIRWRGEVSAGQTVEIQFAQSVGQSFLGINLKCASCHDSFIDRWTLDDAYGIAAVTATSPLQIHRCDKPIGRTAEARWLFPELGSIDTTAPRDERLRQLAALMTHPENGRFTRAIVNRLWYKLIGRGLVHPLDAMQSKPWNEDLLDYLAVHLSDHQYDLKDVLAVIATSEAYQAPVALSTKSESAMQTNDPVWHGPTPRRLTAEQFLDAVWQLTGAGPRTFDAPVFRGVVDETAASRLPLEGEWIWGESAASGGLPPAGETISLRTQFTLPAGVQSGGAVITCDNGFELYVNGRRTDQGNDWTQPQAVALKNLLRQGENTIVVVASNAGSGPNLAGLYFEAQLTLVNGEQRVIATGADWEWNPALPASREGRPGGISGSWRPAVPVPPIPQWQSTIDSQARNLMLQALTGDVRMVRASLMKNDFLMRSLGRPHREQIVSMRPTELTTLEAIDLSNGATLSGYLAAGGQTLAEGWANDRSGLIRHVYRFALSREPGSDEQRIIESTLSSPPTPEQVEDLLWSVLMSPEFLLVR